MRTVSLLAGLVLLAGASAQAADQGTLGQPVHGGPGCQQGAAVAALSPNAQTVAILFDNYAVEVGGATGRSFARTSCNLAIPVTVPDGLSVSVFAVDFLGFNHLPAGAEATFRVEYFFAGSEGEPRMLPFTGPLSGDFLVQHPIADADLEWSGCGEDVILRTNSSIQLRSESPEPAMTAIEAAVGYRLKWRSC